MTSRTSPPTERVLAVLGVLAAHPTKAFGLSELARRADVSKPTCLGIVASLAEHGYLLRDADAAYRLGPAFVPVGRAARRSLRAAPVGGAGLAALSRRFGVPASVSMVVGGRVTVLDVAGVAPGMRPGDGFAASDGALMYRVWDPEFAGADPLIAQVRADGYLVELRTAAGAQLQRALSAGGEMGAGLLAGVVAALAARVLPADAGEGPFGVTVLSAPVFDGAGRQVMVASLHLDGDFTRSELRERAEGLVRMCRRIGP